MNGYPESYSDRSFWSKLGRVGVKAGREFVERALILYYCLIDADTPAWARGVIIGALGYFIFPLDAIPDVVPFTGLADDFGVLVSALVSVARHVKAEHRVRAEQALSRWFARFHDSSGIAPQDS